MLSYSLLNVHVTQSYTIRASSLLRGESSWVMLAVSAAQGSPGGPSAEIHRERSLPCRARETNRDIT